MDVEHDARIHDSFCQETMREALILTILVTWSFWSEIPYIYMLSTQRVNVFDIFGLFFAKYNAGMILN